MRETLTGASRAGKWSGERSHGRTEWRMTYFDRSVGLLNAGRVPDAPRRRTAVLRFGLYGAFREVMRAGGRPDGATEARSLR